MAYCTEANLINRMSEADLVTLSDHDGDGSVDAAVVARAISDADALIDSYLGMKFSVPVSPVPDVLRTRAINLATYFLKLGRDSVTEDARKQYEDDIAWLKAVVAGTVSLGILPLPTESPGAATVDYSGKSRVFGRDEPL